MVHSLCSLVGDKEVLGKGGVLRVSQELTKSGSISLSAVQSRSPHLEPEALGAEVTRNDSLAIVSVPATLLVLRIILLIDQVLDILIGILQVANGTTREIDWSVLVDERVQVDLLSFFD